MDRRINLAQRRTAISTSNSETTIVRGKDLSKELIGKLSFTEYFKVELDSEKEIF